MKRLILITFINLLMTTISFSQNAVEQKQLLPPVETNPPNSDYKPAFRGQTRINAVKTKAPYKVSVVTKDLKRPWGLAELPDGRFLVTEKEGDMRIVTRDGRIGEKISGIPKVNDSGQG